MALWWTRIVEPYYNPTACGPSTGDVHLRARIGRTAAVESPIAILAT